VQELGVIKGHLELARGEVGEGIRRLKASYPSLTSPFYCERYSVLAQGLLRQGDVAGALAALRESLIYTAPNEWLTRLGWMENAVTLTELYQRLGRPEEAAELEAQIGHLLAEADSDFRLLVRLRRVQSSPGRSRSTPRQPH